MSIDQLDKNGTIKETKEKDSKNKEKLPKKTTDLKIFKHSTIYSKKIKWYSYFIDNFTLDLINYCL
jgi:hypothetical protein